MARSQSRCPAEAVESEHDRLSVQRQHPRDHWLWQGLVIQTWPPRLAGGHFQRKELWTWWTATLKISITGFCVCLTITLSSCFKKYQRLGLSLIPNLLPFTRMVPCIHVSCIWGHVSSWLHSPLFNFSSVPPAWLAVEFFNKALHFQSDLALFLVIPLCIFTCLTV